MLLLLMRHGIAEVLREGQSDAERALTEKGRRKTQAALQGVRAIQPEIECIASSPKRRAFQTAQIAAERFGKSEPEIWPELESVDYATFIARLKNCGANSVLLVGHEPDFSRFVAWILTGEESSFEMEFKKAGVCALKIDWSTPTARATLLWHLAPKHLRLMAKNHSSKFSHQAKISAKR